MHFPLALAALLLLCTACAPLPPVADGGDPCRGELIRFEQSNGAAGRVPAYPRAMSGFPGLATNRMQASLAVDLRSTEQWQDWLSRAAALASERRSLTRLMGPDSVATAHVAALEACAAREVAALRRQLSDPALRERLRDAAQVPDNYSTLKRVAGLYPLTGLLAGTGIASLQRDILDTYARPLADLPLQGVLQRIAPPRLTSDPAAPAPAYAAPGIPLPPGESLAGLFARHAPVLEIDTAGTYDRPGAPYFEAEGKPRVDPGRVEAYHYTSRTRLAGEPRLQLNYLWWFDERPSAGPLDTLAGRLDGLLWRVTLAADGSVLLYDVIHPCGCYHLLFPSERLRQRADSLRWPEPPLLPQTAPALGDSSRLVIRVSSAEHFVQRIYSDDRGGGGDDALAGAAQRYALRPYSELYQVRSPGGHRSLFSEHGLVPGTQRGERFYLWPMGIRAPGAMRERGQHAIAFRGRRHFDDADLLERLFEQRPGR